jgi:23S rRNA (adenine2030-N6)-methyltransferase
MLAYRHAFHAGNHADVLKHTMLTQVLRYMGLKDKAFTLIDTHAGAGGYSLQGRYAQTKGEFEHGIGRLWNRHDLPQALADYVSLVRRFNGDGALEQYPGSPAFGEMLMRQQDQMRLFELHPTDCRILESYLGQLKHVEVRQTDGFEALSGQLPPASRRGLILMDPSYELKADYARLIATLRLALPRFAEGVYMVWYPQVQRLEAAQLPHRLQAVAPKDWLHVRLTVQVPDSQGFGLVGSGVFIYNPPYTLHDAMLEVMPYLVDVLGQYDDANYLIEQHIA